MRTMVLFLLLPILAYGQAPEMISIKDYNPQKNMINLFVLWICTEKWSVKVQKKNLNQ